MSDAIQAIDVITKLLPQIKLLTGARRREFYDTLISPLFESFQEVHEFYNSLILDTLEGIEALDPNSLKGLCAELRGDGLAIHRDAALRKMKANFIKRRRRDEYLRDAIRDDAQEMLSGIRWPEERRFLVSVGHYFLNYPEPAPSDQSLDAGIDAITQRGGSSLWETPSTALYEAIHFEHDPKRLKLLLDACRDSLNQKYMNVRRQFKNVQRAIIMKT